MADGEINIDHPPFAPPPWVSVSPFPHPSPRRLSSHFTPPTRPVRSAKQLAWVSLQGRIVGAEEASSAKAIGGGLSREEAVAWELFSPMHRILIVAVIAVSAANSKKNKLIVQLKKSVQIRDQVLLGMQEKLDNLCEQVNYFKDKPDISPYNFEFAGRGCQHCNYHQLPSEYKEVRNEVDVTRKYVDDVNTVQSKLANDDEQEERRMSDLSDWAPSVSSSVDVQWNIPVEHDIVQLQKECEEKNATIKELSDFLNSAESHNSKRIAELEDVIRRKNMLITKLRKDMMVLEQKVIHLTRLRRPSSSKSNSSSQKLPAMSDNLVYDMDSTTSPSDDSDSSARKKHRVPMINHMNKEDLNAANPNTQRPTRSNGLKLTVKSSEQPSRPTTPLKEKSLNQQAHLVNLSKSKESKAVSGGYKSRIGTSSKSNKSRVPREHKRWS
ncbi:hypothetical protein L1987_81927 [Smallanthus sonchifolius]|uniref:Uncharacterized protein n=1 Tax=Smallanthus sonchifolius TaxID=185202 RepID=A0ACB8YRS7_9ASTR|nr:hypothetical protein L1987_81927 [Smallanthus sonchifolius]